MALGAESTRFVDFGRRPSAIPHPVFLRPLFLIAASVAVVAQLALLRSVLIGRAPASIPGRTARLAEIAWVVLPTIVLIGVLVLTWRVLGEPIGMAPVNGVTV
jgi:heme/copper-type cytochrome/quinol oxidase subunit 2